METNDIEKKIQEKLKDYENFDGDKLAMWAAIDEGLDEKKKKRRFFFWFWFGALALVVGFFSVQYLTKMATRSTTELATQSAEVPMVTNAKLGKEKTVVENQLTENKTTSSIDSNNKNTEKDPAANINVESNNTSLKTQKNSERKTKVQILNQPTEGNVLPTEINEISTSILNENTIKTTTLDNESTENIKLKEVETSVKNSKNTDELIANVLLPTLLFELNAGLGEFTILDTLEEVASDDLDSVDDKRWSIYVSGGLSNHSSNYKGDSDYVKLRRASEKNLTGWQAQLELGYQLKNNISLISGIQFSRSWTKFEYNEEKMTAETLDNQVVTYHINTRFFMNDTILEYGNPVVNTTTKRDVKHYNRFDKIQIPLLVSKHFERGRYLFACQAGIGLDIWRHRSGRVVNVEGFISDFNQSETENTNNVGMSLKMKMLLGVAVTDRINIFLQPSGDLSLSDWTPSGDELTQKPFSYGLNMGCSFDF